MSSFELYPPHLEFPYLRRNPPYLRIREANLVDYPTEVSYFSTMNLQFVYIQENEPMFETGEEVV